MLYYRQRTAEPEASAKALQRQHDMRDRLIAAGAMIVGTFTDDETAASGEPEPRPALRKAFEAAMAITETGDACDLAVLRVDAIGGGNPFPMFSPKIGSLDAAGCPVSVRYFGCTAFDRQLRHEWRRAMGAAD